MIGNKKRTAESGTGREDSVYSRSTGRRKLFLIAGLFLAVMIAAAGFNCQQAYADTSQKKTKTVVIKTDTEDKFSAESAKLAKKSRGLTVQSTGEAKAYSSGRLIVSVKDGSKVDFSKYNAATVVQSNFGICLVQFNSGTEAKKAAKKIAKLSSVSYVEPDDCSVNIGDYKVEKVSLEGSSPYDDEDNDISDNEVTGLVGSVSSQSDLMEDQVYQQTLQTEGVTVSSNAMSWGASYIQADKYAAFVKANTKKSIKVAVVDSGVSYHVKLKGRILTGKDFVDNDSNPSDKNGHGTHVAGVIVDCTPGINVKILPVRVMNASGNGSPSAVGNGIRYAVNKGAKVINLSLGAYQHYKYIEQCITYAHNKGATVVVAAGNESSNTKYVCPAHMSTPIVVGAINSSGKRAYFSNYGSSLDITAPGVNIRSCWLKGKYATASGTSMAAPHISAAAAMYRLMNPWIKGVKTQYFVRCYAKDLGAKGTDKYYGRGVPRMAGSITPSKVTLPRTSLSLQVKKSATLKASITPYYAGKNKLTWTSSNKNVVTVSGGKITAKGKGTATVTVKTVNGKKATCKVTVTAAKVTTSSAGQVKGHVIKTDVPSESDSADTDPEEKTDSADVPVEEDTAPEEEPVTVAAAPQEEMKIYIYPSEKTGNTPVQDGSIVAGARLALEAEIVPAQTNSAVLTWKSSDPAIAAVDENGLVTAVSEGEARITASLPAASGDSAAGSTVSVKDTDVESETAQTAEESACVGTYTVKVVKPSILTRHASYNGEDDSEVEIEAVVRVPASLSEKSTEETSRVNPEADYVLAILNKEDEDYKLLGAVNLGGEDSGTVHVHYSGSGEKRTDIKEIKDISENILADLSIGKQDTETGILYVNTVTADGCKADLTLTANLEALRAAAEAGEARTETFSDCVLAVYADAEFEDREEAVEKEDKEKIRSIDEAAVCSCTFTLSYNVPERSAEKAGNSAGENGGGTQTQNGSGGEAQQSDTDTEKSGEDSSDAEDTADPSHAADNSTDVNNDGDASSDKGNTSEEDSDKMSAEPAAEPADDQDAGETPAGKTGESGDEKDDASTDEITEAGEEKSLTEAETDLDSGNDAVGQSNASAEKESEEAGQTENQ